MHMHMHMHKRMPMHMPMHMHMHMCMYPTDVQAAASRRASWWRVTVRRTMRTT